MTWVMHVEHDHPEGSLADVGDCRKCDAVYWNPRLVRATDPRPEWPEVVIATAALCGLVALLLWIF
jgi:hypothetical protein